MPARRDSAQFDAGASIKVECIFVKLADNLNIAIILCHLQTLPAGLCRPQGPRTNLPCGFASYFSGVEKALRAGAGGCSEPARSFFEF
jgi:hypothetical protein